MYKYVYVYRYVYNLLKTFSFSDVLSINNIIETDLKSEARLTSKYMSFFTVVVIFKVSETEGARICSITVVLFFQVYYCMYQFIEHLAPRQLVAAYVTCNSKISYTYSLCHFIP